MKCGKKLLSAALSALLAPYCEAFAPPNTPNIIISVRHPSASLSSSPENEQEPWYEDDSVVTLVPKFKVKDGMMEQYTALLPKFIELVKVNEGGACVHYGFVSCDDILFLDFLHDLPLFSLFGINRCSSNRVCAAVVVVVVEPPSPLDVPFSCPRRSGRLRMAS